MAKHTGRHSAKRSWVGGIAVFVVVALSGYLLMTNVRVNRTAVVTSDTADLVEQGVDEVNQLQQDITDLSSQIDTLTEVIGSNTDDETSSDGEDSSLVLPAVEGEGVTVTLNDSPLWENAINNSGSADNINDYVIHQQDVESVVNALWAGGATAMMIMDQRVLFNSAVICSGNVLSLHGKKYSPPFTISAIGDPEQLREALEDSEAISILQEYVTAFGIGYDVKNEDNLQFPESAALLQPLKYATVKTEEDEE
ncbi:DUF881 domain-containing protein [Bifidobacterium eulemuris]|uniref:DUF881 domain-containing protein n=1 Tax=Bifidobacterium eulemuris TaxID=1765219 RepID=A0A261GF45_9BIFI|nr:DUF881 domain-containing protein [Bifidobacterium eulemuris]OZG69645.1 hypothetical protein BEUL_0062 [Bifidobacterium eulemuris]QOL32241.1 DUF881 domain-containing protein [Bifidobacterium eulemuris]